MEEKREDRMQKAVIVSEQKGTDELNDLLKQGWRVSHLCPMPSSCSEVAKSPNPTCLVVVDEEILS